MSAAEELDSNVFVNLAIWQFGNLCQETYLYLNQEDSLGTKAKPVAVQVLYVQS